MTGMIFALGVVLIVLIVGIILKAIALIIAIHLIVCALLIGIVLIQSGRGGGLVEGFSGVESMFGTKTNAFLTRSTTVLSVLFFVTCVSLAFLSAQQSKSLMSNIKPQPQVEVKEEAKKETVPEAVKEQVKREAAAPAPETTSATPASGAQQETKEAQK